MNERERKAYLMAQALILKDLEGDEPKAQERAKRYVERYFLTLGRKKDRIHILKKGGGVN
jgi:hypothetical protein